MNNQLTELIEKYNISFVQFDGEWIESWTHERGADLYRHLRKTSADLLINSRVDITRRAMEEKCNKEGIKCSNQEITVGWLGDDYAADFQDRERFVSDQSGVSGWGDYPWQAWLSIDQNQWAWNTSNLKIQKVDFLIKDLIETITANGNYMISMGPRADGSFAPEMIETMDKLGIWIKQHAEAIYNTRSGPFYPKSAFGSTFNDNKAWLFLMEPSSGLLELPNVSEEIKSIHLFGTDAKLDFTQSDKGIIIKTEKLDAPNPVTVLEIVFNSPVKMASSEGK